MEQVRTGANARASDAAVDALRTPRKQRDSILLAVFLCSLLALGEI